jgi:hypothetical protein
MTGPKHDIAFRWRVRFKLSDGAFTFVDISGPEGTPISRKSAETWGAEEVAKSKGGYVAVAAIYSIDHEA